MATNTQKAKSKDANGSNPLLHNFNHAFNNSAIPVKMEEFRKIMSESAMAIWAKEVELAKLEMEQATRMMLPPRANGDARHTAAEYRSQLHAGSEKIVGEMRNLSDMMRNCGWQLFDLYTGHHKEGD
jgi:hypothetical protein